MGLYYHPASSFIHSLVLASRAACSFSRSKLATYRCRPPTTPGPGLPIHTACTYLYICVSAAIILGPVSKLSAQPSLHRTRRARPSALCP
ncbi:hypothetical protein CCMA1212_002228 [Trichoderma ghanense]|uniref:Uncharacterized protein n=1 Tax=Trichoderma ghanense TaxID=65468 RepID=A0ABY2HD13_9HYPO